MSQAELPITTTVSEVEVAAIISLFKRIAERGHRIRTQASSASAGIPGQSNRADEDNSGNGPTPSEGE
jgi:hypothetical protein